MTLSQSGYNFEALTDHTLPASVSREGVRVQLGQFFGVKGEAHIVDETKGSDFTIDAFLTGYTTYPLVQTAFSNLLSRRGRLTGTLTVVTSSGTATFPNATFIDCAYLDPGNGKAAPWAGFVHATEKWMAKVQLTWRQTGTP